MFFVIILEHAMINHFRIINFDILPKHTSDDLPERFTDSRDTGIKGGDGAPQKSKSKILNTNVYSNKAVTFAR